MPLVSIIMPAYNCEHLIEQSFQSVFEQTYTNWELLVADDGSSDQTKAIIDRYATQDARIRPCHNDKNQGLVRSRNKLLQLATGHYLCLLDADDWMAPEKLERQVAYLQSNDRMAVGVNYFNVTPNGKQPVNEAGVFKQSLNRGDIYQLPFWPTTIMISRELLKLAGGYHPFFEDLSCFEDIYWVFELMGYTDIGFVNEPLYYYRYNPDSLTNTLNLKRMASKKLIDLLLEQRTQTGTDWLQDGNFEAAHQYIAKQLENRKWQSEMYQRFAAMRVDEGNFAGARSLLKKAIALNPFSTLNLRTILYYMRSRISGSKLNAQAA